MELKRPDWIKVKAPNSKEYENTKSLISELKLNTVCQEAACPNIGECWQKKTCHRYDIRIGLHESLRIL